MFRDRRVITNAFVMPVVLIAIMLWSFGLLQRSLTKPRPTPTFVVRPANEPNLVKELRKSGEVRFVETAEQGRQLIQEGKARLVLEFPEDFDFQLSKGQATLIAHYDQETPQSMIALRGFAQGVAKANKRSVETLLERQGLPAGLAEPIKIDERGVGKAAGLGGASMIVSMLPYLIVLWAFYGGFSIVSDLVAGEKERGTLETLLITPATRVEIAMGKFWALCVVCLLSSLTTLVGVVIVGALNLPATKDLFPHGIGLSATSTLGIFAALIPLVAFFAGLLLATSAYAKNMREAQTYLALISFVVLMPAIFSQFIGFTDLAKATWLPAVPILNTSVAIREALLGKMSGGFILITTAVNLALAAAMLGLVVWLFRREQVLART